METIEVERNEGIVTITLNDPGMRNPISEAEMVDGIGDAVCRIAHLFLQEGGQFAEQFAGDFHEGTFSQEPVHAGVKWSEVFGARELRTSLSSFKVVQPLPVSVPLGHFSHVGRRSSR